MGKSLNCLNFVLVFIANLLFFYIPNSTSVSYGGDCRTLPCDVDKALVCKIGICACAGPGEWDEDSQTCFLLAGNPCSQNPNPGEAMCHPSSGCYSQGGSEICVCHPPLKANTDGKCHLEYGKSCKHFPNMCDPLQFLACAFNHTCQCTPNSIYDNIKKQCVIIPESGCEQIATTEPCIDGTTCSNTDNTGYKCHCDQPLSKPSSSDPTKCVLSYGETCDPTIPICDDHLHLVCSLTSNKCVCRGEETGDSIYNTNTTTCLKLAGRKCNDKMKCVLGAICVKQGSRLESNCNCRSPMEIDAKGFCRLQFGNKCTQQNDLCDKNRFLECNLEENCECRVGSFYDPIAGNCITRPGFDCSPDPQNERCVTGTSCSNPDNDGYKCHCDQLLSKPSSSDPTRCVLSYGETCDPTIPICDDHLHLVCSLTSNKCVCRGEETGDSIYNTNTTTCLRLAGRKCNDKMKCVLGAICVKQGSRLESNCNCRSPMEIDAKGFCRLQFRQECTQQNDLCDENRFLECSLEGNCECRVGSFYDPVAGNCVTLAGFSCNPNPQSEPCIAGTSCNLNPAERKFYCECIDPLSQPSVSDPRICVLSYGQKCVNNKHAVCDPFSNFICSMGICQCQGENITSIYDKRTQSCLRLSGQDCLPDADDMSCIFTALCKSFGGKSVCECRTPMLSGPDGHCYLSLGQNCSRENDFCDPNQFLNCDFYGRCSCSSQSIYDSNRQTCLLLPEAGCKPIMTSPIGIPSQLCVPSTTCSQRENSNFQRTTCNCPTISHPSEVDPTLCVLDHNDPCTPGMNLDLCDPFAHLVCNYQLGRCSCSGKIANWFDSKNKICYLKAGITCTDPKLNPTAQKCTPNSHCFRKDDNFVCECKAGFVQNRNGLCFLPHLSKCSLINDLCDSASFLSCDLENACSCGSEAVFNEETKTCNLLSDANCSELEEIVPSGLQQQPCIVNAECSKSTGKCYCTGDYKENAARQCFLTYGLPCNKIRDDCDPLSHLTCGPKSGKCVCQEEDRNLGWYNYFSKKCYRLEGTKCGFENASTCVPNSFCDRVTKTCKCNATLHVVPNQSHFCFIPYGEKCNMENDLCDPEAFLECYSDNNTTEPRCRCQRQYETYYSPESRSCRLIVDRPCQPHSPDDTYPFVQPIQLCDENARCKASAPGNTTHRCHCKEGFHPNPEGICYLRHQAECEFNATNSCDPYGHLVCRQNARSNYNSNSFYQCLCSTEKMYYNEERAECLTFPRVECDLTPTAQKCRENSHCGKDYLCTCDLGYEENAEDQCLLRYGEKCTENLECHHLANVECRSGFCLCPIGYVEHIYTYTYGNRNTTICLPGFGRECEQKPLIYFNEYTCSPEADLWCNGTTTSSNDDGICICRDQFQQVYIGEEEQCRKTIGMKCDTSKECVPGGECVLTIEGRLESLDGIGICKCKKNMTLNPLADPRFCTSKGCNIWATKSVVFILLSYLFKDYFKFL